MRFESQKVSFEKRLENSRGLSEKYPDRIPCIIESNDIKIDKKKYLIPSNLTLGQFITVIRKRVRLDQTEAMFMFTETNSIPPTSSTIAHLFEAFKNPDGFLYLWIK